MLAFFVAFVTALVLAWLLIPILLRADVLDVPNQRSSHTAPVPRGGGIAVLAAIIVAVAAHEAVGSDGPWRIILLAVALAAVGFADDRRPVSSLLRLAVQVLAGVLVAYVSVGSGTAGLPALLFGAIVVLVVAGYVNAYNFMDGINGISSLTAVIAGLWWVWVGADHDLVQVQVLGAAVAGAMLGFLPWNAPKAKIFLGDVGTYGLGLLIVALSVLGWAAGVSSLVAVAPLAVYGADTGWTLCKRAIGGRPLMEAHREHVYQRLVVAGWSHMASALLCAGATAGVCFVVAVTPLQVGLPVAALIVVAYLSAPSLIRVRATR
ncbi:MraY family glycosyltransferase [Nocardioides gilvus]|uniref:MraY family glycosyltransferase n=1 Tax=Nocardioides gilvus TaxID=1735589 RepID=UPI000D743D6D|nr:glycosyltransferase family 4 protein [Nocardioides gilvus]